MLEQLKQRLKLKSWQKRQQQQKAWFWTMLEDGLKEGELQRRQAQRMP